MAVLYVKDQNGKFIPIPALRGRKGYTPVRGVDYWTEEDVQQIQGYIDEQIADISDEVDRLSEEIVEQIKYTPQNLNDVQKAQARQNIGAAEVEDKYELIETVVCTNGVMMARNQTPDGVPYDFIAMLITVKLNGGAMSNGANINYLSTPAWSTPMISIYCGAQSGDYSCWQEIFHRRGLWKTEFTDLSTNPGIVNQRTFNTAFISKSIEEYPSIKMITVDRGFPDGATVEIKGVWRNENQL